MVQDIVEAARDARGILETIQNMPEEKRKEEILTPLFRQAVLKKLMITEEEESNIRNLVVLSIRMQDQIAGNLSDAVIRSQIGKYDCHQTNLVVQKKILLLMFLERELGIHMCDEDMVSIETVQDLARIFTAYLRGDI